MAIDALGRVIVGSGHFINAVAPVVERAAPMLETASRTMQVAERAANHVQVGSRIAVASDATLRHTFSAIRSDGNDNNFRHWQPEDHSRGTVYEPDGERGTIPDPEVQGWNPIQEFMSGVEVADRALFQL